MKNLRTPRLFPPLARLLLACSLAALACPGARAQAEHDLTARRRLLPEIGAGLRAVKRGADGRLYVLTAPSPTVLVFTPEGKSVGQVPSLAANSLSLIFGEGLDLDATGRVYVADRSANAVKIFAPDGSFSLAIHIDAPTSLTALPGDEVAVASLRSPHLVTVFNLQGREVREFGDLSDVAGREALNRFLNLGRITSDRAGHIYYAFSYLPEPTIRKYDRFGYAALEIELATPEFQPGASAVRRAITRQEHSSSPEVPTVVNAIAVDPASEEVWVALGDQLLVFDRDGAPSARYRTFTPAGEPLEPNWLLVERDRVLVGADPLGIFEFARPGRTSK
jgi:DNA-binding beta-propeller fold protein YncE